MINNTGVINNKTDKWIIITEIKNIKWMYIIKVFIIKPQIKWYYRKKLS